jgi:tetratricopeptide (TPR) repeat protein
MKPLLLTLLFQSSFMLPPRTALENPAAVSSVPQKLKKDYDKLWARFVAGKEDQKLLKDLDKLLKKQKGFDPALMIEGYLALTKGDDAAAQEKFMQALAFNPGNRIAMYYLAELAYANAEFARASTLYAQLLAIDATHPELETKRQKAYLLATDNLLRAAAKAEAENRLSEAEDLYRQALLLAPNEPSLQHRLADLLSKQNRKEEADALRKSTEDLTPRHAAAKPRPREDVRVDDLEDLGRWGSEIGLFHQIRDAEALTREQFAILITRYFPQVTELRQAPQIITDIQNSPARAEILTLVGVGIMDKLPNHDFEPLSPISRGDFAVALARLARLIGVPASPASAGSASDVAESNALYPEIRTVLGHSIMALEESGSFNAIGHVSGRQAVNSAERLLRIFQQGQR